MLFDEIQQQQFIYTSTMATWIAGEAVCWSAWVNCVSAGLIFCLSLVFPDTRGLYFDITRHCKNSLFCFPPTLIFSFDDLPACGFFIFFFEYSIQGLLDLKYQTWSVYFMVKY